MIFGDHNGGGEIAQGEWLNWNDKIDHYHQISQNHTVLGQVDHGRRVLKGVSANV